MTKAHIVRVIALVIFSAPLAVILTLMLFPLWNWFEGATGIEAMGHSGPATWCFIAVYGVFLGLGGAALWRARPRRL